MCCQKQWLRSKETIYNPSEIPPNDGGALGKGETRGGPGRAQAQVCDNDDWTILTICVNVYWTTYTLAQLDKNPMFIVVWIFSNKKAMIFRKMLTLPSSAMKSSEADTDGYTYYTSLLNLVFLPSSELRRSRCR